MITLTIMHADERRELDRIEREKREAERIAYINNSENRVEELVVKIFERVKDCIESGYHCCHTVCKDIKNTNYGEPLQDEVEQAYEICSTLFNEAGYEVKFSEYSKSWQSRSGKHSDVYISW
jgi:uncharacterized protein YbcC (UPF0753/DUF2309 family)